jgi:hypothetical protein
VALAVSTVFPLSVPNVTISHFLSKTVDLLERIAETEKECNKFVSQRCHKEEK